MKKILFYTDSAFFGGSENVLENIISFPDIHRNFLLIYSYAYNKNYKKELKKRRINLMLRPIFVFSNSYLFYKIRKIFGRNCLERLIRAPFSLMERIYLYEFINYFIFYFFIKKISPEVIHINNGGYPGSQSCRTMALAAKKAGVKKIIFTVNNIAVPQKKFFDKFLDKKINQSVNFFTTASKIARNRLIKLRGFTDAKLQSIPNTILKDAVHLGIKPQLRTEFNVPHNTIIIGSVGQLVKRKGYHVLIEAAKKIETNSKWMIFIFGEGPEYHYLNELILKYNLLEHVFLAGFKDNIMDYIADFDVFVLPSILNEDFPNVINEAMYLSKPIVATSVSGIVEQVIDGENGFLVEPNNVSQVSKILNKIVNNKDKLFFRMGNKSKEIYRNKFSYKKMMKNYYNLYKKLN